jgi:tRNA pseudouridine38-40 synthase
MRYFFHIGYNGHVYNGWQRQPQVNSVQEMIESKLQQIFKVPIGINGCGRTDGRVHASQYFFHCDIEQAFDYDLAFRMNKILPPNISVFDVIPVEDRRHARFDAVQRQYDYFINTYKNPFLGQLCSYYDVKDLDLVEMKKAVSLLPKYKDYRAYCTSPDKNEHTICNVMDAKLFATPNQEFIRFHISSNRFLSKMIRILTGKLLLIGKGEWSVDEFESHLISKEPPVFLNPAHPTGLYLSKVTYPFLNLPAKSSFGFMEKDWIEVE